MNCSHCLVNHLNWSEEGEPGPEPDIAAAETTIHGNAFCAPHFKQYVTPFNLKNQVSPEAPTEEGIPNVSND